MSPLSRSMTARSSDHPDRLALVKAHGTWTLAVVGVAAVLALGACVTATAEVAPPRPVPMGERLARENCGECHAIGAGERSRLPDAPHFLDLRARYTREAMAQVIAERMEVLHPRMPLLRLDVDEVPEFLKYWDGLEPVPSSRSGRR